MTDWYRKNESTVLEEINSSRQGLSKKEVEKRLEKHGKNRLKEKEKISPFQIFLRQFKSFLVLILIAAAVISGVIGVATGNVENYIDMAVILIIIVVNAVLGFFQEYKAEKSLEALKEYSSPQAKVIRDGRRKLVDSQDIVPGDILVLSTGDKVPADARIIEEMHLEANESALTGESIPVDKRTEKLEKEGVVPSEQFDMVFAGTVITRGRGKAVVTSTGMDTEMGGIAELVQKVDQKKTPLQERLQEMGKKLGIAIIGIAAFIFGLGLFRGETIIDMFLVAVSLAVAAVPEGLPAVVTVTLAIGLITMVKSNAVVRKLPAVETLGSTTVICSDKTGTLTMNEMTARQIYLSKGRKVKISGEGYEPEGEFKISGRKVKGKTKKHLNMLLQASALCNNSELIKRDDKWSIMGDPTEGALRVAAEKFGLKHHKLEQEYPEIEEVEFTSERKKMTTVHEREEDRVAYMKGAPEVVLEDCNYIYIKGKRKKLSKADKKRILRKTKEMGEDALRVLGVAYRDISSRLDVKNKKELEQNFTFLGLVGMIDPPRPEVKKSVKEAEEAGIRSVMITGDHKITARAIAEETGVTENKGEVITGEEIEKMSQEELEEKIEHVDVYARVSPKHKVSILEALKKKGEVVAMTGDGVNDAPALKKSDIGVAMGIKGTDVSKEASDMVLEDDNYATIVKAVEKGRTIFNNIRKFVRYLLTSNAGEILVIFIAMLIDLPLPLIAVQILWINLLTDGLPAVALGVDPAEEGIMKKPPRGKDESIISNEMLFTILLTGAIMCVGTLAVFNWGLSGGENQLVHARTLGFTTLVVFQLFNVLNCRSEKNSLFDRNLLSNKKLIASIIVSLLLLIAVIYLPILQVAFETVAISLFEWAVTIAVASSVLFIIEIKKWLERK